MQEDGERQYRSPEALRMAVNAAARRDARGPAVAAAAFYVDRLLYRVFWRGDETFILKGGQSLIARLPKARVTRDIDLLSKRDSLDEALEQLKACALADAGDFLTYEFVDAREIKHSESYRAGCKVRFRPWMGTRELALVSVDLVVDPTFDGIPELRTPNGRLVIGGLGTCDYPLYPIANVVADKVCATLETHEGYPSSRIRDLVDLVSVITGETLRGYELRICLEREGRLRGIGTPLEFMVPLAWKKNDTSYSALAAQADISGELATVEGAEKLVQLFLAPLLATSVDLRWNPKERRWHVA